MGRRPRCAATSPSGSASQISRSSRRWGLAPPPSYRRERPPPSGLGVTSSPYGPFDKSHRDRGWMRHVAPYPKIANAGTDVWSELPTFGSLLRERGLVRALQRIRMLTPGLILAGGLARSARRRLGRSRRVAPVSDEEAASGRTRRKVSPRRYSRPWGEKRQLVKYVCLCLPDTVDLRGPKGK